MVVALHRALHLCLLCRLAAGFNLWQPRDSSSPPTRRGPKRDDSRLAMAGGTPQFLPWLRPLKEISERGGRENGSDEGYPWCFTGRLWFRPAIVRVEDSNARGLRSETNGVLSVLSLFGYTVGGTVALEYDDSPVGPYREYVSMGALVVTSPGNGGMAGQWGSRLYVSTKAAERVCEDVWGVPAEVADIDFVEGGTASSPSLQVASSPDPLSPASGPPKNIEITGWSNTRKSESTSVRQGGIPILWTPTLKALWVKLLPFPLRLGALSSSSESGGGLPVHKLRLSASSLSLQFCGQKPSDSLGIPLGIGLSVDNVLIEIGREEGTLAAES